MIHVTFSAARELTAMHTVGETVALAFSAQEPLVMGRQVSRDVQTAIGGHRETLYHHGLRNWQVTTEPLSGDTLAAVIEFLASVEGGEPFTFEPFGYDTGPSLDLDFTAQRLRVAEEIACTLSSEGWSLSLVSAEGTGGGDDWYSVAFTVLESPP